jgi:RNA polymerase sigma factor (sigma-70 family)
MKRHKITEFFRQEYSKLVSYVRRWIDDTADRDAEDIVQEVFVNLFDHADVSIPIENLSAYIYRSLKNRIVDAFRRRKDTVSLESEVSVGNNLSLADLLHYAANDTASEAEKNERYTLLYGAIAALNPQDQAVIDATEMEGRSFRQLSEEWGVPVGTLLARKSRALKKIRKMLEDWEN